MALGVLQKPHVSEEFCGILKAQGDCSSPELHECIISSVDLAQNYKKSLTADGTVRVKGLTCVLRIEIEFSQEANSEILITVINALLYLNLICENTFLFPLLIKSCTLIPLYLGAKRIIHL